MGKLILHIIVAALLIGVARGLSFGWLPTFAIVVVGAAAVHWVWERFFVSPFYYLGAMPVANDDPLMLAATERAKETWSKFVAIYPDHAEDSMVKFRLQLSNGEFENVWGDLLELGSESAKVYLRTPPVGEVELDDFNMSVPLGDIVDWQVEFRDGTLRGGFSLQAVFKIFARQEGHMPPEFQEQLNRFRTLE